MIPVASATRAHHHDLIARPCTDELAAVLERQIADTLHVFVHPVVDILGVVNLWPQGTVSVRNEVRVIAAFTRHTDSPLAWHEARKEIVWT